MGKAGHKKKRDSEVPRVDDGAPASKLRTGRKGASRKIKTKAKKVSGPQSKDKQASKTAKPARQGAAESEIPKLDLGEQILAEQRKVTAVRRKGPGSKGKARPEQTPGVRAARGERPAAPELSERDQVIAEIVATDIERLCGG